MHRQRIASGQQVVHYGENRFLDLGGILRAADENYAASKVYENERCRAGSVTFGIGLKERRIHHGKFGDEVGIGALGRNEEMPSEEVVPSQFRVNAQRNAVAFVRADVAVEGVHFAL